MGNEMAIEVKNLTKKYKKGNKGFEDIHLSLDRGEIFALLGPNGAGKTTFLKVLAGLLQRQTGDILYDGNPFEGEDERIKMKIGGMIGNCNPYPYLTGRENLMIIARYYPHCDDTRIDEILHAVDLFERQNEKVKTYSTGMKQRLAFGMAILHQPKILLLDEPFNGLDIEGKVILRDLIRDIAKKNQMTVIISSHLIHDVEEICDTFGIIMNGKMIIKNQLIEIKSEYRCLEDYFIEVTRRRRLEAV